MVEQIGKYNVEYLGLSYDGDIPYWLIRITEFVSNVCVADKCFYIFGKKIPKIKTENDVEKIFHFPEFSKLALQNTLTATLIK